jgi:hypothetical protein
MAQIDLGSVIPAASDAPALTTPFRKTRRPIEERFDVIWSSLSPIHGGSGSSVERWPGFHIRAVVHEGYSVIVGMPSEV